MELHFDEDQVGTIIAALVTALNDRDENAGMSEFFIDRMKDRIKHQGEEIEALKAKLKAARSPKVAKKAGRPSVKKIAPKDMDAKTAKVVKATGGKAYADSAPAKRGRGRPKKAVK